MLTLNAAFFSVSAAFAAPQPLAVGGHTFWLDELANGLQAISVEDPEATRASVFVVYSVGGRMETASTHGIAHLTEHAVFSGTADVPMGALIETVEGLGGEANAYTRDDFTAYYDHQVPVSALADVLSLEADRMRGVVFDADSFTEERRRLTVEEQGANHPTLQLNAWRRATVFGEQAYGAGTFDGEGNSDAPGISAADVRAFYDRWYQPQRAAVVVVGPPHEQALGLIADAFAAIPAGATVHPHTVALDATLPEPGDATWQTGLTRRRVEWVWAGPGLDEMPDRLALELLVSLYGSPQGEGEVFLDGTIGSSLLVLAATGPDAEADLKALHAAVTSGPISEADLEPARDRMRERFSSRSLRSRPYFSLAVDVAVYARWGLAAHTAQYEAAVDAITADDVEAARAWLSEEGRWTITYTPDEQMLAELPEDREGLAEAAVAATESGDLVRAIAAYERLLAMGANPMNTVIFRYTLGELNYRLRRYDEARRQLKAGLDVIDYPALRELLEEVEAAAGSGGAVPEREAEASPASTQNGAGVVGTEGEPPSWAAQAEQVMAELERWRGLAFTRDLVVTFSDTLAEGLAGYYEPETERLVVGLSNSERFNQGTMLHEMFHALQDQHHDLSALDAAATGDDAQQALAAIIEGEAMLAVAELMDYDFLAHAATPAEGPLDAERFESAFRYGDGQRFILHLRDVGGWPLVAQAFAAPPQTTAEIYHPERYLSGWAPTPVRKLPRLEPLPGERVLRRGPAGEHGLRAFLAGDPAARPLVAPLGAAMRGDSRLITEDSSGTRTDWVVVFSDAHSADKMRALAPGAIAAVEGATGAEVVSLGYLRRAEGHAVRLSWRTGAVTASPAH